MFQVPQYGKLEHPGHADTDTNTDIDTDSDHDNDRGSWRLRRRGGDGDTRHRLTSTMRDSWKAVRGARAGP